MCKYPFLEQLGCGYKLVNFNMAVYQQLQAPGISCNN